MLLHVAVLKAEERVAAKQHDVQHDATRPDVCCFRIIYLQGNRRFPM
jgi:hypothetical protein